ncbi:ankyrin-2-like isoform X2 [Leptopilina heterotoma]|uniref:ankyrin-2-like isoform X2 n=1 Tax=Leptopilina heterotoma TaxID=63436 RepID=UPI001CA7C78B|nr:ankyrin-2-like isoform X2 [Leptopilina heterotoma]
MDTSSDYNDSSCYNSLFLAIHDGKLNIARNLLAAARGHEEIVRLFTKRDADGNTPLHLAVRENHAAVFDLLVEEFNVNSRNYRDETPLHHAAANDRFEFAKSLLENGAIVNVKDAKGRTPLYLAISKQNVQLAKLLFKNGSFLSEECCNELQRHSTVDFKIFEAFKKQQTKKWDEFSTVTNENCPLVSAVSFGHLEVVKYLMKNGYKNSKIIEKDGKLLLETCLKYKYLDILKYLIDAGVKAKENLLDCAMRWSKYDIWKYLLTSNSKANADTSSHESELHSAIRAGQVELVKAIVNNPEDECEPTSEAGKLAVHIAVENGDEDVLAILLSEGFSFEGCLEFEGIKPLHVAATFENTRLTELLLKAGADINSKSVGNYTPLHFAAYALQPTAVKFLLEKGADPHIELSDYSKATPLLKVLEMFSPFIHPVTVTASMFKNLVKITELLTPRAMKKSDQKLVSTACSIRVIINDNEFEMNASNSEFRPDILRCIFSYLSDEEIKNLSRFALNAYRLTSSPECLYSLIEYDDSRSCEVVEARDFDNSECELLLIGYTKNIKSLRNVEPKITYDSDHAKVKVDEKNLLKLIVARLVLLTADNYNLRKLKNWPRYNIRSWKMKCVEQKVSMKETKVLESLNITFYDILTTSVNKLAKYTRNENFLQSLESSYSDFPAYAAFLKVRIEMARRRNDLVDECVNLMYNLVGRNYKIRISISDMDHIFQYLLAVDLRRFSAACS